MQKDARLKRVIAKDKVKQDFVQFRIYKVQTKKIFNLN